VTSIFNFVLSYLVICGMIRVAEKYLVLLGHCKAARLVRWRWQKCVCDRGHPLPTLYPTRRLRHLDPRAFSARYSASRFAPVVQSKKSLNYTMIQPVRRACTYGFRTVYPAGDVTSSATLSIVRHKLKAYLFRQSYPDIIIQLL